MWLTAEGQLRALRIILRQGERVKNAKFGSCHFDRREKSFLVPSDSLGMTGLSPSLGAPCTFARDIPIRLRLRCNSLLPVNETRGHQRCASTKRSVKL